MAGIKRNMHIAIASLLVSYDKSPENEFKVDPTLPNEAIAEFIKKNYLPESLQKYGYLRVERVWRVKELNKTEILDALAHAFSILFLLVNDAEKQIGPEVIEEDIVEVKGHENGENTLKIRDELFAPCMSEFSEYRISWLKLSTNEFSHIKSYTKSVNRLPKVSDDFKREIENLKFKKNTDLFETAQYFLEIGKIVLKKQGFHFPTLILWFFTQMYAPF